jgi:NAD(P)H-dependent FMN reductase
VVEIAQASTQLDYEIVDLAAWPLPADDEPGIPALGKYVQGHTQAWSSKIASADGFVIVTPQYNWGYPAPLKNAIDHLYREWAGKPVLIVSYGGHGGGKCAAQLRQVLEGIKMRPISLMPGISLTHEMMQGAVLDPAKDFEPFAEPVRQALAELAVFLRPSEPGTD